ncbi:MAG TPA: hypothetical protein DET40_04840 [Lentisphaeria bacterium]|nr:MAG: hypothetical protein A2X45_13415 [Lentisphaerae bacterium GWF2_50_93]HCE42852.1 hypothetical protein [Lentisphaeria bacterium]
MKKIPLADCMALASLVVFTSVFIGFFFWVSTWKYNLPGPDAGMASGIAFMFCYLLIFIASALLSVKLFTVRGKITEKWIRWAGFLPIALTIGTPLCWLLLEAMEPSVDAQSHNLVCELISSEQLLNGRAELITTGGCSSGPLPEPSMLGDAYCYDITQLIFKQKERRLEIKSDNCNATFHFDIPDMPRQMPLTEWRAPSSIDRKGAYKLRLELRYRVEKNETFR